MARKNPPEETRFSTENQPENRGRPKGAKNRSTIARAIMAMNAKLPNEAVEKLKEIYPEITNDITIEEAMAIMQVAKAIIGQNTGAYKALMDSAYGLPKQEIDQTITDGAIKYKNVSKQFPDEE